MFVNVSPLFIVNCTTQQLHWGPWAVEGGVGNLLIVSRHLLHVPEPGRVAHHLLEVVELEGSQWGRGSHLKSSAQLTLLLAFSRALASIQE